jgi:hypothetical protein
MDAEPQKPGIPFAVRVGRKSKIRLPVDPTVKFVEVQITVECVNGRPIMRYTLPKGGMISNEKKQANKPSDE